MILLDGTSLTTGQAAAVARSQDQLGRSTRTWLPPSSSSPPWPASSGAR